MRKDEKGVVLLVVLLVLTLMTFLIIEQASRGRVFFENAERWVSEPPLEVACYNAAFVTSRFLIKDMAENKHDSDHDLWGSHGEMPKSVKGSSSSAGIKVVDEAGKFNINSVLKDIKGKRKSFSIDETKLKILRRFFEKHPNSKKLVDAIVKHLKAEGRFYRLEQMMEVPGIHEIYDGYREAKEQVIPSLPSFLTVWTDSAINVNTAPAAVLAALFEHDGSTLAESIIEYRNETPFTSLNDLKNVVGVGRVAFTELRPHATVASSIFRVNVSGSRGRVGLARSFVLSRESKGCKIIYIR